MVNGHWYRLHDTTQISSPSLLVHPDSIENNIRKMIAMSGDVSRLRPHIKTHKTAEIIQMQMRHGIQKFKCATIAEAELLGQCGAEDILLAMQPVGFNIDRFFMLTEAYPRSRFSTLIDNPKTLIEIADKASEKKTRVSLWMDLNNGMDRTGIVPDDKAVTLFKLMESLPHIDVKGLHVYDGHIRNPDLEDREKAVDTAFEAVLKLKETIGHQGTAVKNIIAGGSPTFPIHAQKTNVELSPGTTLLWDAKYDALFPDMNIEVAAVLLTRIISKPAPQILCFDLGHKSIAPEMDFPRVQLLGLEDAEQIGQSEEHLVVRSKRADTFEVGDVFYAIPMHICPTVAKYETLLTVEDWAVTGSWKVAARNQKITI
tara:strand:+ start:1190 stop:2302 length:1113 start_codon:yes stop_codon:yes gene_type:complete